MTKILSLANFKGGVGKTTTTVNLGAALNQLQKKILLIDLDPQSSLSLSLGVIKSKNNIYGALRNEYPVEPIEILEGFDLIPATIDLASIEIQLSTKMDREFYLKEIIDIIKHRYDYVLIDCPPSMGLLTLNAFTASDEIIVPLQSEFLATQGLSELMNTIKLMTKRLNPALIIGGVFLTQYDSRKKLNKKTLDIVTKYFPNELFETKIRNNVSLAEAPAYQQDIFRYSPSSNGAEDYKELAKELIKRHER